MQSEATPMLFAMIYCVAYNLPIVRTISPALLERKWSYKTSLYVAISFHDSKMWLHITELYPATTRYPRKIRPAVSLNNALDLLEGQSKNFSKILNVNNEMIHDQ